MALNKSIIKDSGLETSYHKISKILINYGTKQCIVTMEEYISEDFRLKAKDVEKLKNDITELAHRIEETSDPEMSTALAEKIAIIQRDNKEDLETEFFSGTRDIVLEYLPEDLTYTGIYNELKKLEEYKDAEFI